MSVEIVSTADTLGGRWRIAGTRINVAMLRRHPREWLKEEFTHIPVTDEMIDAALAWTFPPIRPVSYGYNRVTEMPCIDCVCGESASRQEDLYVCVYCGTRWRITIDAVLD